MSNPLLRRIQRQIEAELYAFDNELNKLETLTYPSNTAPGILVMLRKRIKGYYVTITNILSDVDAGDLQETREKLITRVHNPLVSQEIKFLDWVRNAQTANVPWSLVPCIEDLAKRIIPEKPVLVCSENRFNYSMTWSTSDRLAPHPYYILALPRNHRTNVLWHCLVGHELFHPACCKFVDEHNEGVLHNIYKTAKELVPHETDPEGSVELFREVDEQERLKQVAQVAKIVHFAWRRATEELLSDMACVELFGPAAILAMKTFSACSPQNDIPGPDNNFYPSSRYRLEVAWGQLDDAQVRLLCGKLENVGTASYFLQHMGSTQEEVDKGEGRAMVQNHPYAEIAYREVERLLSAARDFVRRAFADNDKWYAGDVIEQIPALVERLAHGIPPNEIVREVDEREEGTYATEPARLAAILNAGWIYESHWQCEFRSDGAVMKYMTMCRLLLKACEQSKEASVPK